MESYKQMKNRQRAEMNALPIRAAFGEKQFAEMMQEFGLPNDKSGYAQIVGLGYGAYIKKTDYPAYRETTERHYNEIRELRNNPAELKKALRYEFANHESQFSLDNETILACVCLTEKEVSEDAELLKIYNEAWSEFWHDCVENDWF